MGNINGKLKGKIIEKYNTVKAFAAAMDKTPDTISAKLRGRSPWKVYEIDRACELLAISKEDVGLYFLP